VTCYVSRAKTGGIKGGLGLAEDKSDAAIECRQIGPISIPKPLPAQEEVFSERTSLIFKKLRIVRMVDKARNTLVYSHLLRSRHRRLAAEQRNGRACRSRDADPVK
jgi:CreA protein